MQQNVLKALEWTAFPDDYISLANKVVREYNERRVELETSAMREILNDMEKAKSNGEGAVVKIVWEAIGANDGGSRLPIGSGLWDAIFKREYEIRKELKTEPSEKD